jgi:hypothetical protein
MWENNPEKLDNKRKKKSTYTDVCKSKKIKAERDALGNETEERVMTKKEKREIKEKTGEVVIETK